MTEDVARLKEIFDHCVFMAEKTMGEHMPLALRWFGRAEALFAAIELLQNRNRAPLNNLTGISGRQILNNGK